MLINQEIPPLSRGGGARQTGAGWRLCLLLCVALATAAGCTPAEPQAHAAGTDWEQFSDPARGVAFRYPRDLGTGYIHTVDWPPQVRVEDGPFTCLQAGTETARAGRTEPRSIGGRRYCVTLVKEGAAGSVYTMYAYATPAEDAVIILTFSLRAVQCGNYDEARRSECERERADFSIDPVIDAIAQSVTVSGG